MKSILKILVFLFLINIVETTGQDKNEVDNPLALDPSIRYGTMENGLHYYIKNLPESNSELNLRLHVKAGTNHQDAYQLNIAHFLEHMAFKPSKQFPQGIVYYLDHSLEMNMSKFAVTGTTGATNTEYKFNAPPNEKALETGLLWFKDIATALTLTTEDINNERGVLVQELLIRNSDNFNKSYNKNQLNTKLIPCNEDYSNYFEHHENFNPKILRQFYKDWYRPESMAVVAVGKIKDLEELEAKIKSIFSDMKSVTGEKSAPNCDSIFFNQKPQFISLEKLPESTSTREDVTMKILYRDPKSSQKLAGFKGAIRNRKINLFLEVLNKRFQEKTKVYNNLYEIQADHTNRTRNAPSAIIIKINARKNSEKEALDTAIHTISQLKKKGVLASEFEPLKSNHLDILENIPTEKPIFWLDGINGHFIHKESFPPNKIAKEKEWLADYSIEEFNNFLNSLNLSMPEDIGVSAPNDHPSLSYTEKQVQNWIRKTYNKPVKPYIIPESPDKLMKPLDVKELKEKDFEEIESSINEVRELVLNNGVRVILKSFEPTPGVYKDKIVLHGFKAKGAMGFDKKDYFSAINAPDIIKNSGFGPLDKFEFQRYLSDNSLWWHGIKPYIKNLESGIKIDADPKDIEVMLQVVYLLLSKPNKSLDAFQDWKINEIAGYGNQGADIKHLDLNNNIGKIIDDYSGVSLGTERFNGIEEVDLQKAYSIYKKLFSDASGFTFIITGNFSIKKYLPLINKYLGNLPLVRENSFPQMAQPLSNNLPIGPVYTEFFYPENYKKSNLMYLPHHILLAEEEFNWKESLKVEALGAVIDNKIWGLRFDKGYSLYDLGAGGKFNHASKQYKIIARFNCVPEELPLLRKEYEEIISKLKSDLVSESILNQSLKRVDVYENTYGKDMTNKSTKENLYFHYRFNTPLIEIEKKKRFFQTILSEDIKETAQKYLKEENFFEFVMKSRK